VTVRRRLDALTSRVTALASHARTRAGRTSNLAPRTGSLAPRLGELAPRVAYGLVALAFLVTLALGSAGLIVAIDHTPGDARPELTWAADQTARPALDAATRDLGSMSADVDKLGTLGRGALAALAGSQWDVLDSTIDEGSQLVRAIRDRGDAIQASLVALPGLGLNAELRLSRATIEREQRLFAAVDGTDGLATAWARLASGSISASELSTLLSRHDELITSAIDVGVKGDTKNALSRIDQATATLDEAARLRDRLQNAVDVTELNEWLRRNRDYDVALRHLYVVSAASPTRVTPELRAAITAEHEAREQLPADTSGLVIIMAEIGRGGLNQAVLAIEEARGSLTEALEAEGSPRPEDTP
jgi:hypothetical protein